jgi:Trk-type K+ transport system membrane component
MLLGRLELFTVLVFLTPRVLAPMIRNASINFDQKGAHKS